MSTGFIQLGRFRGIPVRSHWSVGLIAALFGVSLVSALGVVLGIAAVAAFLASILAHEFGHALVGRRYGLQVESIDLWALGGITRFDRQPDTPRADGLTAVAGPAVNLGIGLVVLGIAFATRSNVLAWIAFVNLALAVFNMLPGSPLDGGRVLSAFRWARTGNRYRASREAANVGRVLGWSMGIIGLALMLNGQQGIFIALTGAFIALNARAQVGASYIGEQLDGVKVRDLTWFGVAHAGSDMDADSMIWQRTRLGEAGGVAVDANDNGELDGVVLEDQLWAIPAEDRAMVMLHSLVVPFDQTAKAGPDEELSSVLSRMNPLRPIVTVWNDGKLLGMIPPKLLRQRLETAQQAVFRHQN